jgi:sulfide-dependent adenosine diphosphate thiazole synthase
MSKPRPAPLRERDITRQIAREYYKEFDQLIESDVIIVGAGPSGLICAHDLAEMGFRTVIVEQSLALGGGFWSGGYLMNKATICEPANEILEEIGVPCKKITECEGMYMVDPPHATGALIAAAYRGGAKIMNLTRVVDLVLRRDGILEGVVVNNTTAEMAGHDILHVDPIALESKIVVDATGHDAVVVESLQNRARQWRHVGVSIRRRGDGPDRRGLSELFRHRVSSGSRIRHAPHGTGVRIDVTLRALRRGIDQEEAEERIMKPISRGFSKRSPARPQEVKSTRRTFEVR